MLVLFESGRNRNEQRERDVEAVTDDPQHWWRSTVYLSAAFHSCKRVTKPVR